MEAAKEFVRHSRSGSTVTRARVLKELLSAVEEKQVPAEVVRVLLHTLGGTLWCYDDGGSKRLARLVLGALCRGYGVPAVNEMCVVLAGLSRLLEGKTRAAMAKHALTALEWSCIVARCQRPPSSSLLLSLATFLTAVSTKLWNSAVKKLFSLWDGGVKVVEETVTTLLEVTPSPPCLLLLSVLARFCREHCTSLWKEKRGAVWGYYVAAVLTSQTTPPPQVVDRCDDLFHQVTHSDFSSILLSPISKSLLRSPDEKMYAVCRLLASLRVDCSRYALELLKNAASQLCSFSERTRASTVKLVVSLAQQCSDTSTCVDMLNHLMAMLKGGGGKLSAVEHRITVLKAIEALSQCPLTSRGLEELAGAAADILVSYSKKESHTGTQQAIVGTLAAFCSLFSSSVSKPLLSHLKSSVESPHSSTRVFYWRCIHNLCHAELKGTLLQFLPVATQAVERAKSPSAQVSVVEEAIVVTWLLLDRASNFPDDIGTILQRVWPVVDGGTFTADKTLSNAVQHSLQTLVKVTENLLLSSSGTSPVSQPRDWLKGLLVISTSESWLLRQQAVDSIGRIVGYHPEWAFTLITLVLECQLLKPSERRREKAVARVLQAIATPSLGDRKEEWAESVFFLCHHPALTQTCGGGVWGKLLRAMSLSPSCTLLNHCSAIVDQLFDRVTSHPTDCGMAVGSVVRLVGEEGVRVMVNKMIAVLLREDLLHTSREDVEIMMTLPTHLWHQELRQQLLKAMEHGGVAANLKRESRAYSYEEQKWELQTRREMMQRRRLLSGSEDVQDMLKEASLTQKQRESIETQLQYEESVRRRMTQLDQTLEAVEVLLDMLCDHKECVPLLPSLVDPVLSCMASPLAGPRCSTMWKRMSEIVLENKRTASLFFLISVQVLAPGSPHPPECTSLPLSSYLPQLLTMLSSLTPDDPVLADVSRSLVVPLLEILLVKRAEEFEYCAAPALATLSSSCSSHRPTALYGHSLFPVASSLSLLGAVISCHTGPLKGMKSKKVAIDGYMVLVSTLTDQEEVDPTVQQVLVEAVSHSDPLLRHTGLRAMEKLDRHVLIPLPSIMAAILVASHDAEDNNKTLATKLWGVAAYSMDDADLGSRLLQLLTEPSRDYLPLLQATADALGQWLNTHRKEAHSLLPQMETLYNRKREDVPRIERDSVGRIIPPRREDQWEGRVGVAKAMGQLGPLLSEKEALKLLHSIIPWGLEDPRGEVREAMQEAAASTISKHGKALASSLMKHFEESLKKAGSSQGDDVVRQCVVVLMGTLASHMDQQDPKIKTVTEQLLDNLNTPSQQVQQSIAKCLVPLVSSLKQEAEEVMKRLMEKLLDSPSYGQRRGAAYGLAGLVKGLGIPSLKQLGVMARLQESIKDKKNYRHREGALFAYEALCDMLKRLFEPYVVHLLPDLLLCFGDGNQYVREATDQAAKTIMAHLSSHGVKLVLPSLLSALEEDSWRTKAGSAELLGAMAFCAPKQLSSCLPSIVPRLMEVMTDSHSKVQHAGAQALKQIASVIKNPEIQGVVPLLLDALASPSSKSLPCLQALINTEFEHRIGPPSLALIMPTIKRSLESRSTDSKKMAAQLIADMNGVTERKDLSPYLSEVLPGLKESLVDPVPEVRTACAQALGAMVQGLGEEGIQEVLPWLLQTLKSETASVDRSGAAQGTSEVLKAQGVELLEQLMPSFVASAQDPSSPAHCRDGYLMLFVYLPVSFGEQFVSFIDDALPPILRGLADQSEYVRDTALLAGQTIINRYASKSVELFLPQLEKGLTDDNWRIRCSSVQLLGDLLFRISGQSGKMSTESAEDDNFGTEEARVAIITTLGEERRNRVLAGLFMGCSDVALLVRQNSVHVWKVVVTTTARTLREILPTLISLLLGSLASSSYDRRQVAARTLGDLVRKLGERVLPEVIPMLEEGLHSEDVQERQGVCIGLSEIIQHTSRDYMQLYADSLLPTIRNALCDREGEVRAAAAQTFQSLHSTVGPRVLDEVLTPLMGQLLEEEGEEERREVVLDGLRHVMAVKSRVVLPVMVPRLIQPPVNTRALALLSSVAGPALHSHLNRVIPALVSSLEDVEDPDTMAAAEGVVLSVHEEPGLAILIEELFKMGRRECPSTRVAAVGLLEALCDRSEAPLLDHAPQLMVYATESLNDTEDKVCARGWGTLKALVTKVIGHKQLPKYSGYLSRGLKLALNSLVGEELRGFALMGIEPALIMLKEGLVAGSPDEKEESARVLVDVILLSSAKTLTSGKVVMAIAGPLIRVLGDRFSWNVKQSVLRALVKLIRKVGSAAKAFIPQLQTSYLKALGDPNRPVRDQAVVGITELAPLSPRVDPVFSDLLNNIKKNDDPALRNTMLQALCGVLQAAGHRLTEKHRGEIKETLVALQSTAQEGNRLEAAKCLGLLCGCLPENELAVLLKAHVLDAHSSQDWGVLQARATTLSSALECAASKLSSLDTAGAVSSAIADFSTSDRIPVSTSGLQCMLQYLNHVHTDSEQLMSALTQALSNPSVDVRQVACQVCGKVEQPSDTLLLQVVPSLLSCCRDKNTAVRAAAEEALVDLLLLTAGQESRLKVSKSSREGNSTQQLCPYLQRCASKMDSGSAHRLEEACQKALSRNRQ